MMPEIELPRFGFHDSELLSWCHEGDDLCLTLEDVEVEDDVERDDGIHRVPSIRANIRLCFRQVENFQKDGHRAETIESEGEWAEVYDILTEANLVTLHIFWHAPRRFPAVPSVYRFSCRGIDWRRGNSGEEREERGQPELTRQNK